MREATWFENYEPVQYVTPGYPPTLLLHGQADSDVPFAAGERMVAALEAAEVSYAFITKTSWEPRVRPDGSHAEAGGGVFR